MTRKIALAVLAVASCGPPSQAEERPCPTGKKWVSVTQATSQRYAPKYVALADDATLCITSSDGWKLIQEAP